MSMDKFLPFLAEMVKNSHSAKISYYTNTQVRYSIHQTGVFHQCSSVQLFMLFLFMLFLYVHMYMQGFIQGGGGALGFSPPPPPPKIGKLLCLHME